MLHSHVTSARVSHVHGKLGKLEQGFCLHGLSSLAHCTVQFSVLKTLQFRKRGNATIRNRTPTQHPPNPPQIGKSPTPIKIKSAHPPLLKKPRNPPLKGGILWAWGVFQQKEQKNARRP